MRIVRKNKLFSKSTAKVAVPIGAAIYIAIKLATEADRSGIVKSLLSALKDLVL